MIDLFCFPCYFLSCFVVIKKKEKREKEKIISFVLFLFSIDELEVVEFKVLVNQ